MSLDTDMAVLEYQDCEWYDSDDWQVLAYIGPDRDGGILQPEDYSVYEGCDLRIRYLNQPKAYIRVIGDTKPLLPEIEK